MLFVLWGIKLQLGRHPLSDSAGLGSASNFLLPDTTGHLKRSCGVHVPMGHSCFGTTKWSYTVAGR